MAPNRGPEESSQIPGTLPCDRKCRNSRRIPEFLSVLVATGRPPPETACYSGRYSASCQATNTLFFNNLSDSFTHIFAQISHMDECSRVPVGGSDR